MIPRNIKHFTALLREVPTDKFDIKEAGGLTHECGCILHWNMIFLNRGLIDAGMVARIADIIGEEIIDRVCLIAPDMREDCIRLHKVGSLEEITPAVAAATIERLVLEAQDVLGQP